MKKLLYILLPFSLIALGQAPQGVNYQAVAYDANGFELSNKEVGVRISIVEGSAFGTPQLVEEHDVITTEQGLFSIIIGQGALLGGEVASLLDIPWGSNTYFLKIELDTENNGSYMDFGTQQFMSVPYALYAESSGNIGPQGPPGESAGPINYDSLVNVLILDSTFISNVSSGSAYSFEFPVGLHGTPITLKNLNFDPYVVPTGKTLHITSLFGGDTDREFTINGTVISNGYTYHEMSSYPGTVGRKFILKEGDVFSSSHSQMNANGILINNSIDATTINISGSPYSVPSNKIFVITSIYNKDYFGDIFINDIEISGYSNYTYNSPLFLGENDQISVQNETFPVSLNGYLVNEDYFEAPQAYIPNALQSTDEMFAAMQGQINALDSITTLFENRLKLLPPRLTMDMGYTLNELISAGIPRESFYGIIYQGGYIFHIDSLNSFALVAHETGLSHFYWGCADTYVNTDTYVGSGSQNTQNIIDACEETAASVTLDFNPNFGFNDWYLPSIDELSLIWQRLCHPDNPLANYSNNSRWSSSQESTSDAFLIYFSTGEVLPYTKEAQSDVLPVRTIHF